MIQGRYSCVVRTSLVHRRFRAMSRIPAILIIVMGVSGCGKSTIGRMLAKKLNLPFVDGDDFHSTANRSKMEKGVPLSDTDRAPWLTSICDYSDDLLSQNQGLVVACSALKRKYRDQLRSVQEPPIFLHLHAPIEIIARRQAARADHFMPPDLLPSQYATLEPTANEHDVIEVSVDQPLNQILEEVIGKLR